MPGGQLRICWKGIVQMFNGNFKDSRWKVGIGIKLQSGEIGWSLKNRWWCIHGQLTLQPSMLGVSSILKTDGTWDLHRTESTLPKGIITKFMELERTWNDIYFSPNIVGGKFEVKNACNHVLRHMEGESNRCCEKPRKYMLSRRVCWFTWKLIRDQLLTKGNLKKGKSVKRTFALHASGNQRP